MQTIPLQDLLLSHPFFEIDYSDITQPNVELKGDFSPVGTWICP
jgi:hypothetical protein